LYYVISELCYVYQNLAAQVREVTAERDEAITAYNTVQGSQESAATKIQVRIQHYICTFIRNFSLDSES